MTAIQLNGLTKTFHDVKAVDALDRARPPPSGC